MTAVYERAGAEPMITPTRHRASMRPEFGCVGLCPGDGCDRCVRLADQISRAKNAPRGPHRDVRLLDLADRVAEVMGARSWLTR